MKRRRVPKELMKDYKKWMDELMGEPFSKILKTQIQVRIEHFVTNNRGYQEVPYIKIFGQKVALQQWLFNSNCRVYNCVNNPRPIRMKSYVPFLVDRLYSLIKIENDLETRIAMERSFVRF